MKIYVVAQSHIDTAWLWTWEDTVAKAAVTFRQALDEMERFPAYTYTQSQAQLYEWMEQRHPDLFARIARQVAAGRWIPVGGMWVEPDANLLRGESLARHLLFGQRYFERAFGRRCRVGWLLDSFGYCATLPQILRGAGLDFFVTTKLRWNDTNPFPLCLFWWEAPDGTRVLAVQTADSLGEQHVIRGWKALRRFRARSPVPAAMLLYGEGDGGHGPRPNERRQVRLLARFLGERIHQEGPEAYFDAVSSDPALAAAPVIRGELYLENHRGTYTTDARIKLLNRRCEDALLQAERFATIAWQAAGAAYPRERLHALWKTLLLVQGHDSISGTVIPESQREGHEALAGALAEARALARNAVGALARQVDTRGEGRPVLAFNPLPWDRDDVARLPLDDVPPGRRVLEDADGREVPSQIGEDVTGRRFLLFFAAGVPSLGYRLFRLRDRTGIDAPDLASEAADAILIRTPSFEARVDRASGLLTSLRDVRRGAIEILAEPSNLLQLFADRPRAWDAWNLDRDSLQRPLRELRAADRVELRERGPVRAVVRVHRSFGRSHLIQDVIFYADLARVEFATWVDWQELRRMLKAAFMLRFPGEEFTCEIPYGTIERPTTPVTPAEQARFEVPLLRFLDLATADGGVSLLNDCKYGADVQGGRVRLSLLRAPTYPGRRIPDLVRPALAGSPTTDRGTHRFTYALYPHGGDWREGGTLAAAAALNEPLHVFEEARHEGPLPAARGFVEVQGCVLEALKAAEDGDAVVARVYDATGRPGPARLRLNFPFRSAGLTDLLEETADPLPVADGTVTFPLPPSAIRTVRVGTDTLS